jgi:hypothetical protein
MPDTLYERDYYEWTQAQARLLRQRPSGSNALDYDNLAEEIEDMGRSQLNACRSMVRNILLHFLKLTCLASQRPARHWRSEIVAFRLDLQRDLSPSLSARLADELAGHYADAVRIFLARFPASSLAAPPPDACPWTWDDILGRDADWTPGE